MRILTYLFGNSEQAHRPPPTAQDEFLQRRATAVKVWYRYKCRQCGLYFHIGADDRTEPLQREITKPDTLLKVHACHGDSGNFGVGDLLGSGPTCRKEEVPD